MLRPGADVVAGLGGLRRFRGWYGHVLAIRGLPGKLPQPERSTRSPASDLHRIATRPDPENTVDLQERSRGDIQMVLDVHAPPLPAPDQR